MRLFKRVKRGKLVGVLAIGILSCGLIISDPQTAYADLCTANGRDCNIGWFFGRRYTGPGHNVISAPALLPAQAPARFKDIIQDRLGCGGGRVRPGQNGTGAAFIVLTMLGYPAGTPKNVACQAYGEWAATVDYWAPWTNYNVVNYNFGGLNTRFADNDVQWFQSAQTSALSIVFYHPTTGRPLYAIKKDCANPVGRLSDLERPKNYALNPTVQGISPTQIESGAKMSAQTRVNNSGEVNSQQTQWEVTMMTVQPGRKAPHEDQGVTFSGTAPCQTGGGGPAGSYFQNGDASCKNVDRGSRTFNRGATAMNFSNIDIGDLPVGTRICFALSVQPRANTDNRWAHSKPVCTTVGKKPKVQIWGDDIAVRGQIDTSTSRKTINGTDKTFGSWVEYGAFSVGANSRFASGSGLADQIENDQEAWSKLTFANKNAAGANAFGQYAPAASFRPLPGVASFFETIQNKRSTGGSVDIGSLTFANNEPILVHEAGDLTITGGNIPAGRSVVIIADGTVTIDGSITYDGASIGRIQDIPQAVIIAQNINIRDSVSRIDSWLVASGIIDTCDGVASNTLTSNKCATKLEVNGPVVTNRLILDRTAGADTGDQSGEPAERFNLRPDAHLWALLQSQGSNKAQTVYSVELPPRF